MYIIVLYIVIKIGLKYHLIRKNKILKEKTITNFTEYLNFSLICYKIFKSLMTVLKKYYAYLPLFHLKETSLYY